MSLSLSSLSAIFECYLVLEIFKKIQDDASLEQAIAKSKEDYENQRKINLAEKEELQAAIEASKLISRDWVEVKVRRRPDSHGDDPITLDEYYSRKIQNFFAVKI